MRKNKTLAAPYADISQASAPRLQEVEHSNGHPAIDVVSGRIEAITELAVLAMDRATRHAAFELAVCESETPSCHPFF